MVYDPEASVHVVIIGNGIAGVTAALALRKRRRDWKITLVSGESDAFFSRTALMYVYMGHMRLQDTVPYEPWFWRERRLDRVRGWVVHVDTAAHRLTFDDGRTLAWDKLVIATGSTPNRFGWPGEDLPGVQGLYSLQDLEMLERHSVGASRAAVVGGGLIGVELAEMLHSRGMHVTLLARESAYWNNALPTAEAEMVGEVIRAAGIDLRLSTELGAIESGDHGRAAAVRTGAGERLPAQIVGLTAGVRPSLGVVAGAGLDTGRGLRVNAQLRTSHPDVYACGDCAEIVDDPERPGRVEQLWYTGRMQGEVCGANVAGESQTYVRGVWFNSAKFFDLEWHTYGQVRPAASPRAPGERTYVWQDTARRRLLRIDTQDDAVVGMNALGLRQRQDVWTRWITERRTVADILPRLGEANFDPEFSGKALAQAAGALREARP